MVEPVIGWGDEIRFDAFRSASCLLDNVEKRTRLPPDLEADIEQRCPDYAYTGFVETLGTRKSSSNGPRKRHVQDT
jgi:hypothetical protein